MKNLDEKTLPLTEAHIPRPVSPYAVARVSQEMISKVYVDGYGLDIIMTRSSNQRRVAEKRFYHHPTLAFNFHSSTKMIMPIIDAQAAGADSTTYEKGKLYEINLNELLADPRNPGRAGGGRLLNRSRELCTTPLIRHTGS